MINEPKIMMIYGPITVSHRVEKSHPSIQDSPTMMINPPKMTPQMASPFGRPKHSSSLGCPGFLGSVLDSLGVSLAPKAAPHCLQNSELSSFSVPQC